MTTHSRFAVAFVVAASMVLPGCGADGAQAREPAKLGEWTRVGNRLVAMKVPGATLYQHTTLDHFWTVPDAASVSASENDRASLPAGAKSWDVWARPTWHDGAEVPSLCVYRAVGYDVPVTIVVVPRVEIK